jgi:hypothetical protein
MHEARLPALELDVLDGCVEQQRPAVVTEAAHQGMHERVHASARHAERARLAQQRHHRALALLGRIPEDADRGLAEQRALDPLVLEEQVQELEAVHRAEVVGSEAHQAAEAPEVLQPLFRGGAEDAALEHLDGVGLDLLPDPAIAASIALRVARDLLAAAVEIGAVEKIGAILEDGPRRHPWKDQVEAEALELEIAERGAHRHEADAGMGVDRNARPEEVLRQCKRPALVAPLDHGDREPRARQVGPARQAVDARPDHDRVELPLHGLFPRGKSDI